MSSKYDRHSHRERDRHRDRRRRRRSPSYDSYDSSSEDSDSSYQSREPSPVRRSSHKSRRAHSDGEDRSDRRGRERERRSQKYYEDEPSPSPTRRNVVEDLLAAVGLIQAKNSNHRSGRGEETSDGKKQWQALQSALTAAAIEAFRTRKQPGGLTVQRLMQIAGAAITAGGLDAIIERRSDSHGLRNLVESVVAGLATSETVGSQVKHKRPGGMARRVGDRVVGMATRQVVSRSLSQRGDRRRSRRH